ncbi:hypothetical protein [Salirhabdus salicampi]|uniref:hypothetical protein n=1 Tax=Salirhabdus salicampi TaxID=476102 RepID=UPI0020C27ED9|nr:hypothetical protein [Salirhabdus salicampi]MCP8615682.1 hypothetical protein [Salirhabdus salicampi]
MTDKERKNKLPDFDSLDDRFIRESNDSPRIAARTNFDEQKPTEDDEIPYQENNSVQKRLLNEFFDD